MVESRERREGKEEKKKLINLTHFHSSSTLVITSNTPRHEQSEIAS